MILKGLVGAFYLDDTQVGGCFRWEIKGSRELVQTHSRKTVSGELLTCCALAYWISQDVPQIIDVKLFNKEDGEVVYLEGSMTIDEKLGVIPFDELIPKSIKLSTPYGLRFREKRKD